jgi:hypothetical protein
MHMTSRSIALMRLLAGIIAVGLVTRSAMGGTTITPMQGSLGNPFNNGAMHGWGWNGVGGGNAGPLIGNLYDSILTINGGAATVGFQCGGPFGDIPCSGAFIDWVNSAAQWGDELHGLAGPDQGGPTAVITSIRYGYMNTLATATHTIQIYDMIPPSAGHPAAADAQFGDQLLSLVLPGVPTGTAIVTVTGLSIHAGTAVWIKFGESGPGFPGTFWMTGGEANGVGTSHHGVLYDIKNYYGPGLPYRYFLSVPYFYFTTSGYVGSNIQVALSGFVLPTPAVISLLSIGGLMSLRRRRDRRTRSCTSRGR